MSIIKNLTQEQEDTFNEFINSNPHLKEFLEKNPEYKDMLIAYLFNTNYPPMQYIWSGNGH